METYIAKEIIDDDRLNNYDIAFMFIIYERNIELANTILPFCNEDIVNITIYYFRQYYEIFVFLIDNFRDYIDITYDNYRIVKFIFNYVAYDDDIKYFRYLYDNFDNEMNKNIGNFMNVKKFYYNEIGLLIEYFNIDYTKYYSRFEKNNKTISYLMKLSNGEYAKHIT